MAGDILCCFCILLMIFHWCHYMQFPLKSLVIQALQALQDAMQPYHNLMEQNSLGLSAATASLSAVAQTLVPDDAMSSMTGTLNAVATVMQPYRDINPFNSGVLAAFETATITPELREFRTQFEGNVQAMGSGLSAISDYIGGLTSQWDNALALNDVLERSIAAQNFAVVRMLPNYAYLRKEGKMVIIKSIFFLDIFEWKRSDIKW